MPDLENPSTYAEWYWKNSVDAISLRAENIEKAISPHASSMLDTLTDIEGMPSYITDLFNTLKNPTQDRWDEVLVGWAGSVIKPVVDLVTGGQIREIGYGLNAKLLNVLIEPDTANILKQRRKITDDQWDFIQKSAGNRPSQADFYYESQKPYPAIPDIITASRYLGDPTNPMPYAMTLFDIPEKDYKIWDWLSYQKLTTSQVQELFKRRVFSDSDTDRELAKLGWHEYDGFMVKSLAHSLPNPMLMAQGLLLQNANNESILNGISEADIKPTYAQTYLDAIMTKPATEDIIAYELRRDPSLSNLHTELRRVGVHENYYGLYKELAYQIPPVADIITMAVREAFTPSIARRFGQYQDLPPDFVEWAGKKGLSKDWAERYWAAHWSLPSPQQGFEMLHRGVIGFDDLNMLLRALDVMPYWRDKLVQIAYKPLSRVDVRRMFALDVLDVSGVRKAYTDLGYNDYNADLMTKFTIEYTKGTPKRLSTADIISAYKKHLIESGTLRTQLAEAGIETEDIEPIIKTAQQRREWSDREDRLNTIEYQYKQGKYSENETMIELRNQGLTNDYIRTLIPQWTVKSVGEKETLWTNAQTLSFMKAGIITVERGKQELTDLGYDEEHINVYLASVTPET